MIIFVSFLTTFEVSSIFGPFLPSPFSLSLKPNHHAQIMFSYIPDILGTFGSDKFKIDIYLCLNHRFVTVSWNGRNWRANSTTSGSAKAMRRGSTRSSKARKNGGNRWKVNFPRRRKPSINFSNSSIRHPPPGIWLWSSISLFVQNVSWI